MIGRADIEMQLERLLASPQLSTAPRMQGLLRYLINAVLDGDGERLKGYSIGIDVFGRPNEFDPRVDSIVRVQAGRLRKILQEYYEGAGAADPVHIILPKGSYIPVFAQPQRASDSHSQFPQDLPEQVTGVISSAPSTDSPSPGGRPIPDSPNLMRPPLEPPLEPPTGPAADPVRPPPLLADSSSDGRLRLGARPLANWKGPVWAPGVALALCALLIVSAVAWLGNRPDPLLNRPTGPVVYVAQYALIDDAPLTRHLRDGLQYELIDRLSRYPDLGVLGIDTVAGSSRQAAIRSPQGADFVLSGSVQSAGGDLQVFSQLVRTSDQTVAWSDMARGETGTAGSILSIQSSIATDVAAQLGQPYGVIQEAMASEIENGREIAMADYLCVLSAYEYARDKTEARHAQVRACLEGLAARSPNYASAWALLSWNYGDEERFGFNRQAGGRPPTERALEASKRAISANPTSAIAYQYYAIALYETGDIRGFRAAAERALALNPNNSEILADVGLRIIQLDGSERGLQMAEKALALNPGAPPWYHAGPAIYALEHGDKEKALQHARAYSAEQGSFSTFLLAAAWRLNGDDEQADRVLEELKAISPAAIENAQRTISNLRLSQKIARLVFGPDWT